MALSHVITETKCYMPGVSFFNLLQNLPTFVMMMMMMIGVLRPLLCAWWAKWAELSPTVMKRSQR